MDSDIIIVGAGVVGCALARVLSRYDCNVVVLEKADDVAEGTSKANSGIVHAGCDAHPGSLTARLNVEGAAMYPALCKELGVPYSCPGALVLGFGKADRATIEKLVKQGAENSVPGVRLIEREEIMAMELNVNGDVVCALYAPTSGLTSPYELTYALADHAALNGVRFERDTEVTDVKREGERWHVQTNRGEYRAKVFVNCAGVFAGEVHNMISDTKLNIIYRRGQYYLLDRVTPLPFRMTMFQCPTRMGKGVLVSPTVHGNVLLGPTAEDIPDGSDVSTTADGLAGVLQKARLTWPAVSVRAAITNFSGIRAHEEQDDFVIGRVSGAENAFEAAGIESPGLSAAPAIAEMLGGQIAEAMGLAKKTDYHPALPQPKPFYAMTNEERVAAVERDVLYGNIVCRCETVTEAEIRAAIRRPVGARSVDGVKRRTRAGMGRCQGGFCTPYILQLLAKETGQPEEKITKNGPGAEFIVGEL